jgi:hypothetical protein
MLAVLVTGLVPKDQSNSQHDDRYFVEAYHRQLVQRLQQLPARLQVFIRDLMHPEPAQRLTAEEVVDAVEAILELQQEGGDEGAEGKTGCVVM